MNAVANAWPSEGGGVDLLLLLLVLLVSGTISFSGFFSLILGLDAFVTPTPVDFNISISFCSTCASSFKPELSSPRAFPFVVD